MSWLKDHITTRALGILSGCLGLSFCLALLFGVVQTERLKAAQATIKTYVVRIDFLDDRIEQDATALQQRDDLITRQNAAVEKLGKASEDNRKAYEARLSQADKTAKGYQAQAQALLSASTKATDELERSRAALKLIQDTISQEKAP